MDARGWRTNPMPEYGDRCHYATGVTFPAGQPPNWTPEPPPLPAADDDLLILIGICILTGHCGFYYEKIVGNLISFLPYAALLRGAFF
ncbi:hypothetical protein [Leptonema illini]|uniref:hypothetical protein n=1 Tax=Leptonema illini TaxID=183 RepID=UPI00117B6DE4|nr:hypothetical protein [Leptonema illini]